jgi:hypothetical protein
LDLRLLHILTPKVSSILYNELLYNHKPAVARYVPRASINVSIPINTGVVRGTVSRVTIPLALDISFEDFFSRVCACMDLDPLEASLGYKFHTDRAQDAPHQLSNEEQL